MKAIICSSYGPPEVLKLVDIPKPITSDNNILVRIHATTVTFGDAMLRSLNLPMRVLLRIFGGIGKSKILGHEFSGVVEEVGRNVRNFHPGDPVLGTTMGGTYAQYISIPADGMQVKKPPELSFEEAAALSVGGNTALVILKKGDIKPGDQVLVYGASGSVGTYAVQLCKSFGAEVTGVCSTPNLDLVKSLGADQVIDYKAEDFILRNEQYDLIFDAVGKISKSDVKPVLKPKGVFLSVNSFTSEDPKNLRYLIELVQNGKLKVVIDRIYTLEEIVEAHRYVDQGHKKGNVVITI
jgi:NADPH:quinone reductase-like Zn-dependent oxidoreductase